MGHVLSEKGVSVEDDKVRAVAEVYEQNSVSEVRSFLGLENFSARFIRNLSTLSEPLRKLTKKALNFEWGMKQAQAFKALKAELARADTLGYFDKEAETQVITDTSPVGLGMVLVQKQKGEFVVIAYASRSLTDVEKRYSQTEKETIGIVWACEQFSMYLLGTTFQLITDCRPLEVLYGSKSKLSAWIERWVLRSQVFNYVAYKTGKGQHCRCSVETTSRVYENWK